MECVTYEIKNGVAIIKLNQPQSLNALSDNLKRDLLKAIEDAEEDPEVKALVLTGEGKAFSAGGDVKAMGERTTLESVEKINRTTKLILRISEVNKPLIAAVSGYAMGAGLSLALAADIIIAEKNATFGLSFVKVGLIPDCGLLYFLPKAVGLWKAKEWIYSGAVVSAEEALESGLINKLVENGDALNESITFAENLAEKPIQTISFAKSILNNGHHLDLKDTIQYENYAQAILQQTEDHKEGLQAFKEKRKANFKGK